MRRKNTDPRLLIGGYVTGSLNRTESEQLTQAALEDQALFDELLELESLRNILADPQARSQIKSDLRQRVERDGISILEKARRFLFRPGVIPALSFALMVLLVVLVRQGIVRETSPAVQVTLGPEGMPLLRAAGILEPREGEEQRLREVRDEPVRQSASGEIAFDRLGRNPSYRVGDPMRIGFKVSQDASVVMLEEREDGTSVRLFPNRFQSTSEVRGRETILVPPAGQGPLEVEPPAGRRTVRVLVFPPNLDPLDPSQSWEKIRQRASMLERTYEVQP